MFALVDCNNFFASCETIFNPKLEGRPVVVLSNNDGNIVARSKEAKALGIPMGGAYHQWLKLMRQHQVAIFSTNPELYANMSNRVMSTLNQLCPEMEIYSVDEAFLWLKGFPPESIKDYCLSLRKTIKQWTGVTVSIGIAPTKTLCKIANHFAKRHTDCGVFDLRDEGLVKKILINYNIEKIWGIGIQLTKKLHQLNIHTAYELRHADLKTLRKRFSVVMERIILELRGQPCLPLEAIQPKKQIMCSRSFGRPVTVLEELEEAVSHYTAKACIKLRMQQSNARGIYVFLHTNFYAMHSKQYSNGLASYFPQESNDTSYMIGAAKRLLKKIYKKGYAYHKVGLLLLELVPNHVLQADWLSQKDHEKSKRLMKVIDKVNWLMGKQTVFFAAEGIRHGSHHGWRSRCHHRSPRYTTRLEELVVAFCKD